MLDPETYPAEQALAADVCVIGSGAGGAVAAAVLAEAGLKVVVLEEGGHYQRADFNMREADMYPKLYQDGGGRATEDLAISILQGRCIGGGTTVNWTTCFRTPDYVLEHWKSVFGITGWGREVLEPSFSAVETRLNIRPALESDMNPNNRVLWEGARAIGLQPALVQRNVVRCFKTGYCGVGCPVDAKQGMHLTYLKDAVARRTTVYPRVRVTRLVEKGAQIVAAEGTVLEADRDRAAGKKVSVAADTFVLAGGAINSPALLLRSALSRTTAVPGRRTFLHPAVPSVARFAAPVRGFSGAPQTVALHHYERATDARLGFFIEAAPLHPMLTATTIPMFGDAHRAFMEALPNYQALIAILIDGFDPDSEAATVRVTNGSGLRVRYRFHARFWAGVRAAMRAMAEIQLAAGAEHVATAHTEPLFLRSASDLAQIERAPTGPLRQILASAHQMGGCAMGARPESSVVDPALRHWGYKNLYVMDGSVFPTAVGVNPSESIYAFSHRASQQLASALRG